MGKTKSAKKALKAAAGAEHRLTEKLAKHRGNRVLKLAGAASEVADQPPLVAISLATLVVGLALRRPAVARSGARMLVSHALATGIKTVLKGAVDRTRPAAAIDRGQDRLAEGTGTKDPDLNSFPSGHTAGAVAVARAASRGVEGVALPATLATGAIAAVQMPRGKHYLTDVAVGGAIGWIAEGLVNALFRWGEGAWRHWAEPGYPPRLTQEVTPPPS